jgi:hypothetical protein
MKPFFGDLPDDARALLTQELRIDFTMCSFKAPRWFSAWARDENDNIAGIFAVEFPFWFEGKVNILVLDPRCMSWRTLRAIFTALFSQARRLTAEVEPHNRRALRQMQRMGWQYEGYRRLGLEGTRDTLMFGMLKHECRYLPGYVAPSPPLLDVRDRVLVDPVLGSDHSPVSRVGTDQFDLFGGQGGADVGFADASALVQVGAAGLPAEVLGADAARHPAGVRSVHFAARPSIHGDTDETMHFTARPVRAVPHLRVAPLVDGKRPKQALVPGVGDGVREKILRGHRSFLTEV